jgi:hypothetical protein
MRIGYALWRVSTDAKVGPCVKNVPAFAAQASAEKQSQRKCVLRREVLGTRIGETPIKPTYLMRQRLSHRQGVVAITLNFISGGGRWLHRMVR